VVDVACGTGNAALLAAARGARVVGVDGAERLLDVACQRARTEAVAVDFREGDLLDLLVDDGAADVVLSVFGVIFAQDPAQALREIARVPRPEGRALITRGPMPTLGATAAEVGLVLDATTRAELPIRAASVEAYIATGEEHPMALAVRPVAEQAGVADEIRDAMTAVLRKANEDPDGFLVHSPYVVHELRRA
jgi:ubiquinone/menaquinone biosynthesis C-methylase UbiE